MTPPVTLPLVTDFKKEYKFIWYMGIDNTRPTSLANTVGMAKDANKANQMYLATLGNPIYCGYVGQLAEIVALPDDEWEIEPIRQGMVTYQMPKADKMNDITVTYLDDSLNSVYNFHKTWKNAFRQNGVTICPPTFLAAKAFYIEFEDVLTTAEYIVLKNQLNQTALSAINQVNFIPSLPLGVKPTSITTYPHIYPTKISRTAANHGGKNLAKVTVTYARIPDFKTNRTPLQYYDGGEWKNVSETNADQVETLQK